VFLRLALVGAPSRRLRVAAGVLAVVAALAYPNFGFFHVHYRSPIHWHDTFHYFVGAKYLPELGYTRLYEATWAAGREMGAFAPITHVRDLGTYAPREVASIDAAAVRARFAPARWQAFKRDLLVFGPRIDHWNELFMDFGYNDPPPRALALHLLVRWVPATPLSLGLLTSLDYLIALVTVWVVRRVFGGLATALAFAFLALSFFARFDFIGGALLRWDWIAAILLAVAALARGAGVAAGLGLGYAALARVFPAVFLLPLAIKWVQARVTGARDAALSRSLAAAAALVLAVGLALAAVPQTRALSEEFVAKIRLHNEGVYANHVGLGSLLVFHAAPWVERPDGSVFVPHAAALAARPAPWVVPLLAAASLALVLPLILAARPLPSMMYAVPLVFVALSPAGYYYSFLVLLVLLPWRDGTADPIRLVAMAFLALVSAAGYAFELGSGELLPLFYKVSIQLALFFVFWLGFEYVRLARRAAPAGAHVAAGERPEKG
jgi:hypothetical protein